MNKLLCSSVFLGILSMQLVVTAAPMISVDSVDFDAGTVYEGAGKSVKHTFTIKNTGDESLVIQKIRASCGCTAVDYDSIIQPGASGKVTQEIAIDRIGLGEFRKYITIHSNAKNNESLRLSLGGVLKAYIEFPNNYIQMKVDSSAKKLQAVVEFISTIKDLKISEISFKSYSDASDGPAWQSSLPLYVDYNLSEPQDTKDKKGYSYRLKITTDLINKEKRQGRFLIKTNHPLKPEVAVEGSMI
ncbi:MAG: DUF1573 domain-containing protein [Fibrobacter sp.]|jgi:hypothetical protein|nr:DUF1573 domain-containing protein [Fibrobacter sp.]